MDGSKVIWQKVSFLAYFGHFGAFLTPFDPLGSKREFFSKIRECQFLSFMDVQLHAKFQKNLMSGSWDNCGTNGRTDGRTNGRTDGHTPRYRYNFLLVEASDNLRTKQTNKRTNASKPHIFPQGIKAAKRLHLGHCVRRRRRLASNVGTKYYPHKGISSAVAAV